MGSLCWGCASLRFFGFAHQGVAALRQNSMQFVDTLIRRLIVALAALAFCVTAADVLAEPGPRFQVYDSRDGLSNNWVRCILQDHLGYIWFGTKDGLNRFDAYDFKVYAYDAADSGSLRNSSINDLVEDDNGDLWICTSSGVEIYRRERERFERLQAIPPYDVLSVARQGRYFWFGTAEGLFRYDPESGGTLEFTTHSRASGDLLDHMCFDVFLDTRERLWIGTEKGLSCYDGERAQFFSYPFAKDLGEGRLAGTAVNAIVEDGERRLWVATTGGGLFVSDNAVDDPAGAVFSRVIEGSIKSVVIDHQARLWAGHNSSAGLDYIDLESADGPIAQRGRFQLDTRNAGSVIDSSVQSLYEDRDGNIWAGTYSKGVSFYSRQRKPFHFLTHVPHDRESLPHDTVNVIEQDGDALWFGTESGLARLFLGSGLWEWFPTLENDASSPGINGIYAIHRDTRGDVWFGSWADGLSRFDRETKRFVHYREGGETGRSINNNNVFAIQDDGRGSLWIGTIGGGLNRLDLATGEFTYYMQDPGGEGGLHDNYVNDLMLSSDGTLWVSTYNTLNRYDEESDSFTYLSRKLYQGEGMSNADLLVIFEDSRQALWLGTEGGLVRYAPASGEITQYTQINGLDRNTINAIEEDAAGNLWLSSNQGLVKFVRGIDAPAAPQFFYYDTADGLLDTQFNPRASLRSDAGQFYFGGTFGVTYFDPDLILVSAVAPLVVINDFLLSNRPVDQYDPNSPLKKAISVTESLTLGSEFTDFGFRFAALNYLYPEKVRYRFRLEGFERDWNETSTPLATYTNVPAGEYVFQIMACNNDGIWSGKVRSLRIKTLPVWWKSGWYQAAAASLAVLLVAALYRWRVASLERQRQQLRLQVEERTRSLHEANVELADRQEEISAQNAELERHRNQLEQLVSLRTAKMEEALIMAENSERLKSAFLANVSHEVRTPMNAIVGFSSLLEDSRVDACSRADYVGLIRSNADLLLSLIDQILEISRIDANQVKLNVQPFDLDLKFEELEQFHRKDPLSGVDFRFVRPNSKTRAVLVSDELLLEQVMNSLLGNAFKYTKSGLIEFGYEIEGDWIHFYVSDTGIGIPAAEHEKIFDRFYKSENHRTELFSGIGLGLSITKSLVHYLGGEIGLTSEVGKGSRFFFRLPYRSV